MRRRGATPTCRMSAVVTADDEPRTCRRGWWHQIQKASPRCRRWPGRRHATGPAATKARASAVLDRGAESLENPRCPVASRKRPCRCRRTSRRSSSRPTSAWKGVQPDRPRRLRPTSSATRGLGGRSRCRAEGPRLVQAGFREDMADLRGNGEVLVNVAKLAAEEAATALPASCPLTKWVPSGDELRLASRPLMRPSSSRCLASSASVTTTLAVVSGTASSGASDYTAPARRVTRITWTFVAAQRRHEHLRWAIADGVPIAAAQICFSLRPARPSRMCSLCVRMLAQAAAPFRAFATACQQALHKRERKPTVARALKPKRGAMTLFGGRPRSCTCPRAARPVADRHAARNLQSPRWRRSE